MKHFSTALKVLDLFTLAPCPLIESSRPMPCSPNCSGGAFDRGLQQSRHRVPRHGSSSRGAGTIPILSYSIGRQHSNRKRQPARACLETGAYRLSAEKDAARRLPDSGSLSPCPSASSSSSSSSSSPSSSSASSSSSTSSSSSSSSRSSSSSSSSSSPSSSVSSRVLLSLPLPPPPPASPRIAPLDSLRCCLAGHGGSGEHGGGGSRRCACTSGK